MLHPGVQVAVALAAHGRNQVDGCEARKQVMRELLFVPAVDRDGSHVAFEELAHLPQSCSLGRGQELLEREEVAVGVWHLGGW